MVMVVPGSLRYSHGLWGGAGRRPDCAAFTGCPQAGALVRRNPLASCEQNPSGSNNA